jgi:hypothetical protein
MFYSVGSTPRRQFVKKINLPPDRFATPRGLDGSPRERRGGPIVLSHFKGKVDSRFPKNARVIRQPKIGHSP